MPRIKKKEFTKENSVRFFLYPGNPRAINADGESLQSALVPVPQNYKSGSRLIMSHITGVCHEMDQDDAEVEKLPSSLQKMILEMQGSKLLNEDDIYVYSDDSDDDYDVESQLFPGTDGSLEEDFKKMPIDYSNCPENLQILNARFEKVLDEYEEEQIGPLDDDEICEYLPKDCNRAKNLLDSQLSQNEDVLILEQCDDDLKEKILSYAEDSEEEKVVEIITEKPLEFDCESILSTYSNKYNHPTVIKEEKVKKIKIPNNPLKKNLTKSQLKQLETEDEIDDKSDDDCSSYTISSVRLKDETPEQRRERKSLFKEAKRESRMLKKENKLLFKKEKKLQKAQNLNVQRNAGIKLL